ncbi:alpha/beta hydrolase [Streptomyces sp. NPDC058740]|uniref:alpha/beta hydrolase n=1 Tax=Streptomyces sp. NPDC058740 TaxID=3346619 RepID=UPI00367BE470
MKRRHISLFGAGLTLGLAFVGATPVGATPLDTTTDATSVGVTAVDATTVGASTTDATTVGATAVDATTRAGAAPASPRLRWGSCVLGPDDREGQELAAAGAECAGVTVPLDYRRPQGRTLTVAISRIKATDRAHRIGALLLNDGGPGGPTIGAPPRVAAALKGVARRYDIIGMDPRFVGRSDPLDCGWPVGSGLTGAGNSRASFERQVAFTKDLAAKCRANAGDLLPHASTRNTARDMDRIRAALGERKLNYLGVSYGTYLGTVYGQMFPGRVGRVVLDGALDPRAYGPTMLPALIGPNEHALAGWADWAAARNGTYGLGRTGAEVLAAVRGVAEAAGRAPLVLGTGADTFRLDDTQVPWLLFGPLGDDGDENRAFLADAVRALRLAADGRPTGPLSPDLVGLLRHSFTDVDSASASAQMAILCADGSAPRDPEVYWRAVEASRAAHPVFGPALNNLNPCAFWERPRERRTEVRRDMPALIVAATGDPRTPYPGSVALHELLPGSRLVTLEGVSSHGLYGFYGNACVDEAVNAYLGSGQLPTADLTCGKAQRAGG